MILEEVGRDVSHVEGMTIGQETALKEKARSEIQGHLRGDGVPEEVDLVVVAGDHIPHNTRGNGIRLQPTYRRLCTQNGARRETRGTVEGAHRELP